MYPEYIRPANLRHGDCFQGVVAFLKDKDKYNRPQIQIQSKNKSWVLSLTVDLSRKLKGQGIATGDEILIEFCGSRQTGQRKTYLWSAQRLKTAAEPSNRHSEDFNGVGETTRPEPTSGLTHQEKRAYHAEQITRLHEAIKTHEAALRDLDAADDDVPPF